MTPDTLSQVVNINDREDQDWADPFKEEIRQTGGISFPDGFREVELPDDPAVEQTTEEKE